MFPYLAHVVAFHHHHILPTPFPNSLTFTSCMSTVPGKLSVYFLMRVIFALTAARFLTNALRVWESMVLRIGKESANLPIYVLL